MQGTRYYLDTDGTVMAVIPPERHRMPNGNLITVQWWIEAYPKDEYKVFSTPPDYVERNGLEELERHEVQDIEPALLEYLDYRGEEYWQCVSQSSWH